MRRRLILVLGVSAVALAVLSYLGAAWLETWPVLGDRYAFRQLWVGTAVVLLVVAIALAIAIKLRRTWYRRLAFSVVGSVFGAEIVRWVALAYLAVDAEPPDWVREWLGGTSGATALGAFLFASVLAVLDFLTKHGDRIQVSIGPSQTASPAGAPTADAPRHQLEAKELSARQNYLRFIKQDVENRLASSIHSALFLQLGIEDTPDATHLPWVYRDTTTAQQFATLDEAISAYNDRVLLLGAPGSGKTMTLLHIAERLITSAQEDERAPIPLLVNLTKLRLDSDAGASRSHLRAKFPVTETDEDHRVRNWLIDELSKFPGISRDLAGTWIDEGRIAALLDGLDEVDDHRRARVVSLLNETYLFQHPGAPTVVCSRINEYLPLQSRQETRLQLEGSITLQPLSAAQIDKYLGTAGAEALIDALPGDEVLQEMARNPLTLSMMTLAYGASVPAAIDQSVTERRHTLMEAYVARMLQRKERRDQGIPFDESPSNTIPPTDYAFTPERVDRTLGWLAVRMSVRMQTALPPDGLYSFLCLYKGRDQRSEVWWATALTRGVLVAIATWVAGFSVAPLSILTSLQVAAVGVVGLIGCLLFPWQQRPREARNGPRRWLPELLLAAFFVVTPVLALGVPSTAFAELIGWQSAPAAAGVVGLCIVVSGVMILIAADDEPLFLLPVLGTAVASGVAWTQFQPVASEPRTLYLTALTVAVGGTLGLAITSLIERTGKWEFLGGGLLVLLALAAVAGSAWLLHPLGWLEALLAFVAVCGLLASGELEHPQLPIALLTLTFAAGGLAGGAAVAVTAVIVAAAVTWFVWYSAEEFLGWTEPFGGIQRHSEALGDRHFLSPVLRRVLTVVGVLPNSVKRFEAYGASALLLKRSGEDLEFVHRMLRDYFALRDLQPQLASEDGERRMEAIRSLGFQGDAAVDALAEFFASADPPVQAAAVWALGRIASPTVEPYLDAALTDPSPVVKSAAIGSVENRELDGRRLDLLAQLVGDPSLEVRQALLEMNLRRSSTYGGFYLFEDIRSRLRHDVALRKHLIDFTRRQQPGGLDTAIELLAAIGDDWSIGVLHELFDRIDTFHRIAIVRALGRQPRSTTIPTLLLFAEQANAEVHAEIVDALHDLGTPAAAQAARSLPAEVRTNWFERFLRR